LAETGSMRSMNIETDVTLDRVEVVFGADECAATQTVHFADSVAFRWLCETNAIADQNVSNIHSHATGLDHDRIMAALLRGMILKSTPKLGTKATRVPDSLTRKTSAALYALWRNENHARTCLFSETARC
jgi:hypothetical protein